MRRALRVIKLIEDATEPKQPEEPDPTGDKYRKDQVNFTGSGRFARKNRKSRMLDGSYNEEPGFYIGCPKCGEVGHNRKPKGDESDNFCRHCKEPLVLMGSVNSKNPADAKVIQAQKNKRNKLNVKSKTAIGKD